MSYFLKAIIRQVVRNRIGAIGVFIVALFFCIALCAPLLASNKPLFVIFNGKWYFPLFRFLLSPVLFTKKLDLFFNTLLAFSPLFLLAYFLSAFRKRLLLGTVSLCCLFFFLISSGTLSINPTFSLSLLKEKVAAEKLLASAQESYPRPRATLPNWQEEMKYMTPYKLLCIVLENQQLKTHHEMITKLISNNDELVTAYTIQKSAFQKRISYLEHELLSKKKDYLLSRQEELSNQPSRKYEELVEKNRHFEALENEYTYIKEKHLWLEAQEKNITLLYMPIIRPFHWEASIARGNLVNQKLPLLEKTRTNKQDLFSSLIFGSRISLFVGITSTCLALLIGIPLGLIAGYYTNKIDLILCRLVEVWESMPTFFILLLIISITQTKSLFIIISIIALFYWMQIFRFTRAEAFRQRTLGYVLVSKTQGFPDGHILYKQILPNCLLAVSALLPFNIMTAIIQESAISFLGLGEESSCSWGTLMNEANFSLAGEQSLIWPPAVALCIFVIGIVFIGDAFQKAIDSKQS